jgi:Flp pilus assembly protein TadG
MNRPAVRSSTRRRVNRPQRRGAVTVLIAILLVPMMAMVAFAIDIAWIVQSRSDLQAAADAAALAGAEQLMGGFVQYSLPSQTNPSGVISTAETTAKTYAKNFASYNTAGGVSSLALNDSDIEFGFTDASNTYTPAPTYSGYPNTVKVTLRLDSQANGPLKLFFARLFGVNSSSLQATAAATIYTGTVNSFQSTPGFRAGLLPMTLDINAWNTYVQTGKSSDGSIHADANGAPQMQVYPSPNLAPGNFGLLSLNDSSNASSDISTWITQGMSPSDIDALKASSLIPLAQPNPGLWDWKGAPGFKAGDLNSLTVGQTYLLALFEPVVGTPGSTYEAAPGTVYQATDKSVGPATVGADGTGQNSYYNIVKFVGVKITTVDNSKDAFIQPAADIDPTAIFDLTTVVPAGTSSQFMTTFSAPKLTQ